MPFVVVGTGREGPVRQEYPGAKTAFDAAMQLLGEGFSDVTLTDPNGRVYRPTELPLLLNNRGKFES
ncbi:MAG: hypothetical protein ACRD2B_03475 [Terriglobia bacterium]